VSGGYRQLSGDEIRDLLGELLDRDELPLFTKEALARASR
jgi:hypothetical protein